jgi:hypothetical protein
MRNRKYYQGWGALKKASFRMSNLEPSLHAGLASRASSWAAIAAVVFILLIVIATLPAIHW